MRAPLLLVTILAARASADAQADCDAGDPRACARWLHPDTDVDSNPADGCDRFGLAGDCLAAGDALYPKDPAGALARYRRAHAGSAAEKDLALLDQALLEEAAGLGDDAWDHFSLMCASKNPVACTHGARLWMRSAPVVEDDYYGGHVPTWVVSLELPADARVTAAQLGLHIALPKAEVKIFVVSGAAMKRTSRARPNDRSSFDAVLNPPRTPVYQLEAPVDDLHHLSCESYGDDDVRTQRICDSAAATPYVPPTVGEMFKH